MTDLNYNRITKPLTLGTVNFGMPYGITNSYKKVSKKIAIQIIRKAIMKGVEYIDTASNYGESEEVIGLALLGGLRNRVKLITKISPLEKKEILDVDVGGGGDKSKRLILSFLLKA